MQKNVNANSAIFVSVTLSLNSVDLKHFQGKKSAAFTFVSFLNVG